MLQPQHYSHHELIKLLQHKDKNAFSYLYDTYASSLFGTILKIVKNDKLAIKILEKVFLNIWNEIATLGYTKQSLFVWLYSITYRTVKAELIERALNKQTIPELVA